MSYKFFINNSCEYFPCHKTDDLQNFNCLFCYCPLYAMGGRCPGNKRYIVNSDGSRVKDCSGCTFPHRAENYDEIVLLLAKEIANGLGQK